MKKRNTWCLLSGAVDKKLSMYSEIINAAKMRNDQKMLSRVLITNRDFEAVL